MVLRLGFTESTLLFYYYLRNVAKVDISDGEDIIMENNLLNWLYTTSGFYDKKVRGSYFDFNPSECRRSEAYGTYMNRLLEAIKRHKKIVFNFHKVSNSVLGKKDEFLKYLGAELPDGSDPSQVDRAFSFMDGKNILIVNPMSELMASQYRGGNLKNIYGDYPRIIRVEYFENPYTFFNSGNDASIIDTADKACRAIKDSNYDFDGAIISCGAYSCLLADFIKSDIKKDCCILSGMLMNTIFGIKSGRQTYFDNQNGVDRYNQYWVSAPDHLKPKDYMKIEKGCYW